MLSGEVSITHGSSNITVSNGFLYLHDILTFGEPGCHAAVPEIVLVEFRLAASLIEPPRRRICARS